MNNLIDTIPFIGVRGDVLIETRDAKTGKLAQRSEGHNLFTNYGLERFKKSCAGVIGTQYGRNIYFDEGGEDGMYSAPSTTSFGLLKYLYLTDNASSISAEDNQIPGTVTGFASRQTYSGSDTIQGNVNLNECIFGQSSLKAVFDFGTDRGNGTHKSVFFSDRLISLFNPLSAFSPSGVDASFVRAYTKVVESDDGYFYGFIGTTLYKINAADLTEITTYTLPATPTNASIFDVSSGYCYFATSYSSTTLYVFNLSDSTSTTITLPAVNNTFSGAVNGGYLYYPYSNTRIYKVDVSTGTSEYNNVTLPYNGGFIFRCGSQLYWAQDMGGIYAYNYSTNTLSIQNATLPSNAYYLINTYSMTNAFFYNRTNFTTYYNGSSVASCYPLFKLNPIIKPANMITGRVLDAPVTKNNTQAMKVTYTITFS